MSKVNIIYGILGCGGISFLAFFLSSKIGTKSKVLEAIHNLMNKQRETKIKEIEKDENVIKVKLKNSEQVSKVAKNKIKSIQKKAVKEIENILKENKISNISKEINSDWEDI